MNYEVIDRVKMISLKFISIASSIHQNEKNKIIV